MQDRYVLSRIREKFQDRIVDAHALLDQDTVIVGKDSLRELAEFLKNDPELDFNFLMDVTAVDYWKRKPRFELVYHFLSLRHRNRLRVKTPVGEPDPEASTLSDLWVAANWYEREVYDMYGIRFTGHPDLRRILMYPEFEGHPLRKDYPINRRQPLIGPKD